MVYFSRKGFMVLLVSILLTTQSYATGLNSVFNGTAVSSDFGTWKSPRTGSKYFYGGSYTFAFKGAGRYQPFFQGEAPSAKIGCGGFSLSGGFVALLGIDEIKILLKNSGATLAWGIMIGLKYTLPAIADVFESLRKFARELQKLLQNSCQLGQVIGKLAGEKLGLRNSFQNSALKDINTYATKAQKGIDKWTSELESFNKGVKNGCINLSGDAKKTCENKKSVQMSGLASKIAIANSSSMFAYTVGSYLTNAGDPTNTVYVSLLSTFLNTGNIGSKVIVTNADKLKEIRTTVLLTRLFFGDFSTPASSLEKIFRWTIPKGPISANDFKIDHTRIENKYLADMTGQLKSPLDVTSWTPPVVTSAEQVAKALIDGITSSTDSSGCYDGYCVINDDYVYLVDYAYEQEGKDKIVFAGTVQNANTNKTLKVEWDGAYIESLKVIRSLVAKKSGYSAKYTTSGEAVAETTDPEDAKVPLLLPNIFKYLDNIILLEKKAKGETPYTAQLKTILARQNGYFYATTLVDFITAKVLDAMGKKGQPGESASAKVMIKYKDDLMKKKDAILEKIHEDMKNQISYKDLAEMFQKLDVQIRKDNIKGY